MATALELPTLADLVLPQESDRVRNAICLLKSSTKDQSETWSCTGFYADVKLKNKDEILDVHCIMTNYHVFLQNEQYGEDMMAVFHHEGTEKEVFELPLVPFNLLAHSEELNYMLIKIDESAMQSIGVKPILADSSQLPVVKHGDRVYIIQHPGGTIKDFSQDTVRSVNKPFIEYYGDAQEGPSGSPVFVLKESKFLLVALHISYPRRKGVLVSEILDDFDVMNVGAKSTEAPVPKAQSLRKTVRSIIANIPGPSYTDIIPKRGKLARILSHLNSSFTCRAYVLYRRIPSMDMIDISVVLLSEFVDEKEEEYIKQLMDHFEAGYVKGEKGMLKRVRTERYLEMCVDFPGVEKTPFVFKVDQAELDSVGFVINHFKGIAVKSPAKGIVEISEVRRSPENKLLWRLHICEMKEGVTMAEKVEVRSLSSTLSGAAVYPTTKLTNEEISQISPKVALEWDSLAGLMDISYAEREEIRTNDRKYPSLTSKAKRVFELYNDRKCFDRHMLVKYFEELRRHDLENEMTPVEDEDEGEDVETPTSQPEIYDDTRLSSREMYRLSQHIVVDWDKLAGLMDITRAERDDIRYSVSLNDSRSRAEKILSIINNKKDFSRGKLVDCLKAMQSMDLISPVTTGAWRSVFVYRTTKLTNEEISRISREIGIDWDSLAGLMDIPYAEREKIRVNVRKYPTCSSKAKRAFELVNDRKCFDRHNLVKYFEELRRHDLKNEMLPVTDEDEGEIVETPASPQPEISDDTRLSSRETYRLSCRIVADWDRLAGLMNITRAERDDIRCNCLLYNDGRTRAEKILSIFNQRDDFSREKLAGCLKGMQMADLISPVTTGEWRSDYKSYSTRPDLQVKKTITTDGGVVKIDDVVLEIGPGCLAKDTEITLKKDCQSIAPVESLFDLGLVDPLSKVVQFLPTGLKFLKPADLTVRFEKTVSDSECFILHGFYNKIHQRIVWELVNNGIEEDNVEGVGHVKINSFSFFMFILARRGKLARILSHLKHSFTCRAYLLYRRQPSMDTMDISVVMLSEFLDEDKESDIKQLKYHFEAGFVEGETGVLKRVYTDRLLEMCLCFPEIDITPFYFNVDQPQLDSVGFVIDNFKRMAVKSPASGAVKISDIRRGDENESLWELNVCEMEDWIQSDVVKEQFTSPDPQLEELATPLSDFPPEVVYRTTKLTNEEISQISHKVGLEWDGIAGLMDIPYAEREEIRVNCGEYPKFSSKAKRVFELVNDSKCFDRHNLVKYFEELRRYDLRNEMLSVTDEDEGEDVETSLSQLEISEVPDDTPLSSREMYRLSQRIVVDWEALAGLMDITTAERGEIRCNYFLYSDSRSRAEKILSIFNQREDFSREKLAACLKEIQQLELVEPVTTGEWRKRNTPGNC